jgi:hypothetical protein
MSGFEDPDILPLGSIMPLTTDSEELPDGFEIIEGQTIRMVDNPDFVGLIYGRLRMESTQPEIERIRLQALDLFTGNGGEVEHSHIKLPTFTPEEAAKHTWGEMPLPQGMPDLKLIIKTKRTVTSDG